MPIATKLKSKLTFKEITTKFLFARNLSIPDSNLKESEIQSKIVSTIKNNALQNSINLKIVSTCIKISKNFLINPFLIGSQILIKQCVNLHINLLSTKEEIGAHNKSNFKI